MVGLGTVALLGLLVLGYVINLRCDAVLYARTVNGLRRYFYEGGPLDLESEQRYRVLPKRTQVPRYLESYYFLFVVLTFAVVGTAYWSAGMYFFYQATARPLDLVFVGLVGICPLAHVALYEVVARYRERRYLKSRILGVDIDGVINEHRRQFSDVLGERTGKRLDPEAIVRIPVHEIPGCTVEVTDERAVFNWPHYWTTMPEMAGAAEATRRIRNELGYDVWFFTYRPWPHPEWYPPTRQKEYRKAWNQNSRWSRLVLSRPVRWAERSLAEWRVPEVMGSRPIGSITKAWLRKNGFRYDRLVIERGNADIRDPLFLTRNRFIMSAKKEIRAFVEDDLGKAKRLSDVCEVVFLIDQPYNRDGTELPKNIVRVNDWRAVYEYLRYRL